MRTSYRLAAVGIAAFVVASPASAALNAGEPFFVADPRTDGVAAPGVARTPDGFVVAWAAEGELAYRGLDATGALGDAGDVALVPYPTDALGYHDVTRAAGPVHVVSAGSNVFVSFQRLSQGASSGFGTFTKYGPAVLPLPPGDAQPFGVAQSFFVELAFATTGNFDDWASLAWSWTGSGPFTLAFAYGDLALRTVGPTLASIPFTPPGPPSPAPGDVALAASGIQGYLAAWSEGSAIKVAPITTYGMSGATTQATGWSTAGSLDVVWGGENYVLAWVDEAKNVRVGTVDEAGLPSASQGSIVATDATRILELASAGDSSLLVYETAGDGGVTARAVRLDGSGALLDADALDLGSSAELGLTTVKDGLWLAVQASHALPERTLLQGRFIGDVLPPAPDNAVPPPSPRADGGGAPSSGGAGGSGNVDDASVPSASGGARATGGATNTGGTVGTGGRTPSASGGATSAEAGSSPESAADEGNCDCSLGAHHEGNGAVAVLVALMGLSLFRHRRFGG